MQRFLYFALAVLSALQLFVLFRAEPTSTDAPVDRFSTARATEVLQEIAQSPRPVGSEAHEKVRALLRQRLEQLGYHTEEQRAFACGARGTCGFVTNLMGKRAGTAGGPTVLLSAHYDTVAASPGAGDDGFGVAAVVESARALAQSPTRRSVAVLLTDGEESGLLGAEAFADHPWAKDIGFVINVDARGTHGPSQLFETSSDNAWVVDMASRELPRPATSSLYGEVFRLMPFDTDFTALRRLGARGVNFANSASVVQYHTPLDSLANIAPSTLEHHGTQVFALAHALSNSDVDPKSTRGDAVWFDLLEMYVVRWPAPWSLVLAFMAFLSVLAHALRSRGMGLGLLALPVSFAGSWAATMAVGFLLHAAGALPAPWVSDPTLALLAMHCASIAGGGVALIALARKTNPRALWAGVWLGWSVAALALAYYVPGASYLAIGPAFVAGMASSFPLGAASIISALGVAVLAFPRTREVYEVFGFANPALTSITTTLVVATLAPLLSGTRWRVALAPVALTLMLLVAAIFVKPFSPLYPQPMNVAFRQNETESFASIQTIWGSVNLGSVPKEMMATLGDASSREVSPAIGVALTVPEEPQHVEHIPAPEVVAEKPEERRGERGEKGHARSSVVRIRSRRGARTLLVERLDGREVDWQIEGARLAKQKVATIVGVPEAGIRVTFDASEGPVGLRVYDVTLGLPPGSRAHALADARTPTMSPFHDGDVTIATTETRP